ncbi:hypothetical protein BN890_19350 [Bacteroides xylanisolvens SD CC 1b]|uniref:Uncharacterized protein n=1 Tax=Bacteroides xylanisolvens SD CC 1b TaxID=702447 RepID=W6PJZ5_9BACE|nr:response regulator [Bacteroides ovatus str. 3725 D1 iv]KDS15322.1 response regulator [Bacteroides fragilis str. 3725 D9 ii]CDM04360.1 hypothetical protein BN890_19350 [Bacteroides xylanisolvens SD CC 1b]
MYSFITSFIFALSKEHNYVKSTRTKEVFFSNLDIILCSFYKG